MNIIKDHIPYSDTKRPNIKMTPTSITIHSTANPNSTAKNERGWLTNPSNKRSASWHYVVDEKDYIEAIPSNEVAYHSGTTEGNRTSISIEMCESGNRERVVQRTIELVRYLMDKHNIRVIKRHYDWSKKNCPQILNDDGKWSNWFDFLGAIFNPPVVKKESAKVERDINVVSEWAKKDWEEARANGYFDGTRPGAPITREEAAIVINRLRRNILELIEK